MTCRTLSAHIARLALIASSVIATNAAAAPVLDQSQEVHSGFSPVFEDARYWQTFTPGVSGELTSVELLLAIFGTVTGDLTIDIVATSGGIPTSTVLGSTFIDPSSASGVEAWIEAELTPAIPLVAGTMVALRVSSPATSSGQWRWRQSPTDEYAGGNDFYDFVGGAPIATSGDFTFRTYMEIICGNNAIDPGEQCDDGNQANGDCCSSTCQYAAINTPCTTDGVSCTADICNASGVCQHVADNTACSDNIPCTADVCNAVTDCSNPPTPVALCASDAPGKASLSLSNPSDAAKRKIQFKWGKGTFPFEDLGSPLSSTDFALCVYDASSNLVAFTQAYAGVLCGADPCWTVKDDVSVTYKDKGKPPSYSGASGIKGKAGVDGKAKIQIKGGGTNLPAMSLGSGVTGPVTAQIMTDDAGCWEAVFSTDDESKNDGTGYKATASTP